MLGYYIVKIFSKFMCISPMWLRKLVAKFLGSVAVAVVPRWRMQMAEANIRECLGVDEARAAEIAADSLHRFGRMVVEVMRFPLLNKDNIDKKVKVEGLEYLEAAYAQGKGVIMATGHYGNWELLGATVALHGYPMLSITRKQNNGHMDKLINEFRQMVGQKVTYNRGEHGLLAISRMLREKIFWVSFMIRIRTTMAYALTCSARILLSLWDRRRFRVFTVHRFYRYFCTTIQMAPVRLKFILPCTPRKQKTRSRIFMW